MTYNFSPFPVLETERLTLRELNINDAKAIFGLRTNKEVNEFIDRKVPKNLSEARAFIDLITNLVAANKGIFWVIESKNNHQLIGTIGLRNFEDEDHYAELGYELHPDYQQRGFMDESFDKVLEFGFQQMELKTIGAFTDKNNTASIALLEKRNFVFDPEIKDEGFVNNISYRLKA